MIRAVLFDLDGTLADTAPDLGSALNHMRGSRGLPPLSLSATRPVTSLGARGLLKVGFGISTDHADYAAMRREFLEIYEGNICRETRLFPGMTELLGALETRQICWGIVTNKAEQLARLLLDELGLTARCACIIGGDTTPNIKPHPAPLLAACRSIRRDAGACLYVGDDLRDIEAGRAAGMKVAAARWGYLNGGDPVTWNADWLLEEPRDLLRLLPAAGAASH
jgi:N-acetyl-D-muramate 6-phosphate phosphatase